MSRVPISQPVSSERSSSNGRLIRNNQAYVRNGHQMIRRFVRNSLPNAPEIRPGWRSSASPASFRTVSPDISGIRSTQRPPSSRVSEVMIHSSYEDRNQLKGPPSLSIVSRIRPDAFKVTPSRAPLLQRQARQARASRARPPAIQTGTAARSFTGHALRTRGKGCSRSMARALYHLLRIHYLEAHAEEDTLDWEE